MPPEVPAITKSQALSILEEAAKQNRKLEAEVKRLSQQVGIAAKLGCISACSL